MLRLIFALAVGTWLGATVCVSFVVAPAAHGNFPTEEARRFLRPIFPAFYRLGVFCGIAALTALAIARHGLAHEELVRLAAPTAFALIANAVSSEWLLPKLQKIDGGHADFARLHQTSTMLNSATLGALLLAMAGAVTR
jgi:Domain of unknown function (DUF4149)